jgi:hypothetical protein
MAATLALEYTERNDNKIITLTDVSTGWSIPAGVDINTLTLQISITTSDNVTVVYDDINLKTKNSINNGTTQAGLIFSLDASELKVSGIPLGAATDELPDGIWEFHYILNNGLGAPFYSELNEWVLMEGNVRNGVYEALRTIPILYECDECKSKEIMDAIFAYGYLNSMRAGGYVAKTEELLGQLYTLERLLSYGSSYTW